jgi:hypothetical protein
MYPSGINGRGMIHQYTWKDVSTARLKNFSRGMIAQYLNWLFYGIERNKGSVINGTLIPIHTDFDLTALLRDEGVIGYKNPMYAVEDVTHLVSCDSLDLKDARILTLVTEHPGSIDEPNNLYYPRYVEKVFESIHAHGDEFVEEFLNTGGVHSELSKANPIDRYYSEM